MYRLYHHAGQAAATKPEHLAIARAIRDRDPEAASAAMVAHLRTALDRLNAVFAGDPRPADGSSATSRQG
jgi:DNA-binding GntR family transcriptional regulator